MISKRDSYQASQLNLTPMDLNQCYNKSCQRLRIIFSNKKAITMAMGYFWSLISMGTGVVPFYSGPENNGSTHNNKNRIGGFKKPLKPL